MRESCAAALEAWRESVGWAKAAPMRDRRNLERMAINAEGARDDWVDMRKGSCPYPSHQQSKQYLFYFDVAYAPVMQPTYPPNLHSLISSGTLLRHSPIGSAHTVKLYDLTGPKNNMFGRNSGEWEVRESSGEVVICLGYECGDVSSQKKAHPKIKPYT